MKLQATREACFVCGSTIRSSGKTRPPLKLTFLSVKFSPHHPAAAIYKGLRCDLALGTFCRGDAPGGGRRRIDSPTWAMSARRGSYDGALDLKQLIPQGRPASNFALDAGKSRAEDSAWRMSPKATLPRCTLFSNASTPPGTSRAITFVRSNRRCLRSIR